MLERFRIMNLAFNLTGIKELIQDGLTSITPKHWSDCVNHVKQVERDYWASDNAKGEMPDHVVIALTESDEETDTADESEDEI